MIYNFLKNKFLQKAPAAFFAAVLFFAPLFTCAQTENKPDIPKIIPRSEWGAGGSSLNWPAEYAKIEKFVVHHTASSNLIPDSDGSGEYKNMVNNIYGYHSGKKIWHDGDGEYIGFGDIGYNYLIDPNGNIYEGRYGGSGVVAGHVNGYNIGSVGISVLGRYQDYVDSANNAISSHPVTSAIKKSLESLIGWLAANNNIDLNKITDFHGKNIDGVVGHKDLAPTICPGDELYKELDNIRNNANVFKKEYENYAYQIAGETAIYVIAGGYKMKFDSKDVLPSAYKNKTILPISKFQLDAYKYRNSVIYPDGSLLREFDAPEVYYIENSKKRHLAMAGEEFVKMGFAASDIKKVLPSDLKIYENGKIIKYAPDGQLIKDRRGNVFLAENGKKRKFTSAQLFEFLDYRWENIKEDGYLSFYLDGLDMIYPNGVLVKQVGKNETYLIENKQKREISSSKLMNVLKYNPADIISITENELNHFPAGEKMKYPDNTLVKTEDSPAVYLIKNGKRKKFSSAVIFEKLGYKWNNIINITNDEIKNHPADGKVLCPDGFLIKFSDNPAVYILEGGKKRKITSAVLFEKRKYKWSDIVSLNPEEIKDYPNGEIIIYPDGTLIKREGFPVVYKIEGGKRKEFTSLALFEATRSKWSDVIALNKDEFLAYPDGGIVKYPENTLLKEKGVDKIYVIKNGRAEWIKTAEEFKKAGYKWSGIIEISKAEMSLYIITENIAVNINPVPQTPRQNDVEKTSASSNSNNINSHNTSNGDNTSKNNAGENNPNIRVAIYSSSGEDVKIAANGNYTVNYYNSDGTINKTENKSSNEQTIIPYFNSSSYVKFIPASKNVILKILSYEDLSWNKAINDNEFRGNIEIKYSDDSKKLWVINELPLEDYINGIAEALNDSPEEYLKAFGTIARTYAMYYIKKGGKHIGEPFHLKNSRNGNGNDQVYKGYNFELRAPKIVSANKSTAGQIITYKNEPIVAAYSSDSGGITKNGCEFLSKNYCGENFVYLQGRIQDPENTQHDQNKISASHGVGMSAVGAYQMAADGSAWREIIKYYYSGVEIERYY